MSDKTATVDTSINNPDVVTKYKAAGEISNKVLADVKSKCVTGASILELCKDGDAQLVEATNKIYKGKKDMSKGVAFPTTISPNHVVAHLSPLDHEPEAKWELKKGDVVKICLGAQIDGYGSIAADTVVVDEPATGKKADVIAAAWYASEAAIRTIKPGNKNFDVTKIVDQICKEFDINAMEGMLSNEQKQNVVDGKKRIILNPSEGQKRDFETCTFEEGEVYGLDILVTTGDGKCNGGEKPTTIFKKNDITYQLRLKASRATFSELQKKAGAFPFTLRSMEDIKKARMGLSECVNHQLITPYEVMYDKPGQFVAQFFTTIALTKTGTLKFSGAQVPDFENQVKTEKKIENEDIKQLISQPLKTNKKKKAAKAE